MAAESLKTVYCPADPDVEAAWAAEIERRVTAIEAGAVELELWEEVKRQIEGEILRR